MGLFHYNLGFPVGGMVTAAEMKGAKLGLVGKIIQAAGVGVAVGNMIGGVLSDMGSKTVKLSSSRQSMDPKEAVKIAESLKEGQ